MPGLHVNAVAAADVVFAYDGVVAVGPSTFTIPQGLLSVAIGPNGSGKSTLLNGIAGLITPRSGVLEVAAPVRRISYVMQVTKVNEALPVTVAEVVAMGRYAGNGGRRRLTPADREAVAAAMDRTGVTDLADTHLRELSAGQRQRVFLAQGLAQEHDTLLLDEPLTGIDLPTAQAIDAVIHEEIGEGCAVVMTSHDLSEAQAADHVLLLSGRVVAAGPPEVVLTADNLIAAYGAALHHVADGQIFIDDPAHRPAHGRHVHLDRTVHTDTPGGDWHAPGS